MPMEPDTTPAEALEAISRSREAVRDRVAANGFVLALVGSRVWRRVYRAEMGTGE